MPFIKKSARLMCTALDVNMGTVDLHFLFLFFSIIFPLITLDRELVDYNTYLKVIWFIRHSVSTRSPNEEKVDIVILPVGDEPTGNTITTVAF